MSSERADLLQARTHRTVRIVHSGTLHDVVDAVRQRGY